MSTLDELRARVARSGGPYWCIDLIAALEAENAALRNIIRRYVDGYVQLNNPGRNGWYWWRKKDNDWKLATPAEVPFFEQEAGT